MSELPCGWATAGIGEFLDVQYGSGLPSKSRSHDGGVPVYGSSGITGSHSDAYVNEPAIIIGRKGSAGAIYLTDGPSWPIDTTYFVVPPHGVSLLFLFYQLQYLALHKLDSSTTIPSLRREDLEALRVVLAPTGEQERIVAAIEEEFSRINAAVAALERVRSRISVLWRSIVDETFNDVAAAPREVGNDIFRYVTSGSRGWAKYYAQSGPLFIRVANVPRHHIRLALNDVQCVAPPAGAEGRRTAVKPGDLVVTITADIGRVAVIPEGLPEAYINQHVAIARPRSDLSSEYLAWFISGSDGQKQLTGLQRGVTKLGLGLDDIRSLQIPVPDIGTQNLIATRLTRLRDSLDQQTAQVGRQIRHTDWLRSSVLAAAFSGSLVPQEPTDQAASVLLDRIATERASYNGHKPTHIRQPRTKVTA
jgi:type I restriction enzyme, S subunit